jgi:hypothetical protein
MRLSQQFRRSGIARAQSPSRFSTRVFAPFFQLSEKNTSYARIVEKIAVVAKSLGDDSDRSLRTIYQLFLARSSFFFARCLL